MRTTFDAGLAAYAAGNFAAAVECFNRVVDERHDDADAHNNLGLSYLALGEYEDAADAFTLAVHFRPQFPPAFYNMALAALGLGELGQAVTSLERALALQPDFATAHSTLGYVLSHQVGEFEAGATQGDGTRSGGSRRAVQFQRDTHPGGARGRSVGNLP